MPTVVPIYKRAQRRTGSTPSPTAASTPTSGRSPHESVCSSGVHGLPEASCYICRKDIKYYQEELTCGHKYHADCYWRWIRVRSNLPEEKSICPRCGFLETPVKSKKTSGRIASRTSMMMPSRVGRVRKASTSSDSSTSSSGSSETTSTGSSSDSEAESVTSKSSSSTSVSTSTTSSKSSGQMIDLFFL
jgi:hypothetical protein